MFSVRINFKCFMFGLIVWLICCFVVMYHITDIITDRDRQRQTETETDRDNIILIDLVLFNGENELFAIRAHELEQSVSHFYVFEGECSFTGKQKQSQWNDSLVQSLQHKISFIRIPCYSGSAWSNERRSRDFM